MCWWRSPSAAKEQDSEQGGTPDQQYGTDADANTDADLGVMAEVRT